MASPTTYVLPVGGECNTHADSLPGGFLRRTSSNGRVSSSHAFSRFSKTQIESRALAMSDCMVGVYLQQVELLRLVAWCLLQLLRMVLPLLPVAAWYVFPLSPAAWYRLRVFLIAAGGCLLRTLRFFSQEVAALRSSASIARLCARIILN